MKQAYALIALVVAIAAPNRARADSFWDGFDNNNFNSSLWTADSQRNGEPFGCTFYPSMIQPGTNGNLALTLHNGACAELKSKAQYLYGTAQTRMQLSNVPGTVASLFTYNSWYDNPGNPWTEIDIEFLPSEGNTLHTNIIYQASANAPNYQWEKYIDLGQYGINPMNGPIQVGFDWTPSSVAWYVFDNNNNKQYVRVINKSNSTGCDCIPDQYWPTKPARIFANYWHGDNSNSDSVNYFPKSYNYGSGSAIYDWIQFIDY